MTEPFLPTKAKLKLWDSVERREPINIDLLTDDEAEWYLWFKAGGQPTYVNPGATTPSSALVPASAPQQQYVTSSQPPPPPMIFVQQQQQPPARVPPPPLPPIQAPAVAPVVYQQQPRVIQQRAPPTRFVTNNFSRPVFSAPTYSCGFGGFTRGHNHHRHQRSRSCSRRW
jgi:hypothetical protein